MSSRRPGSAKRYARSSCCSESSVDRDHTAADVSARRSATGRSDGSRAASSDAVAAYCWSSALMITTSRSTALAPAATLISRRRTSRAWWSGASERSLSAAAPATPVDAMNSSARRRGGEAARPAARPCPRPRAAARGPATRPRRRARRRPRAPPRPPPRPRPRIRRPPGARAATARRSSRRRPARSPRPAAPRRPTPPRTARRSRPRPAPPPRARPPRAWPPRAPRLQRPRRPRRPRGPRAPRLPRAGRSASSRAAASRRRRSSSSFFFAFLSFSSRSFLAFCCFFLPVFAAALSTAKLSVAAAAAAAASARAACARARRGPVIRREIKHRPEAAEARRERLEVARREGVELVLARQRRRVGAAEALYDLARQHVSRGRRDLVAPRRGGVKSFRPEECGVRQRVPRPPQAVGVVLRARVGVRPQDERDEVPALGESVLVKYRQLATDLHLSVGFPLFVPVGLARRDPVREDEARRQHVRVGRRLVRGPQQRVVREFSYVL